VCFLVPLIDQPPHLFGTGCGLAHSSFAAPSSAPYSCPDKPFRTSSVFPPRSPPRHTSSQESVRVGRFPSSEKVLPPYLTTPSQVFFFSALLGFPVATPFRPLFGRSRSPRIPPCSISVGFHFWDGGPFRYAIRFFIPGHRKGCLGCASY